jgi:four helix bundle protein
MEVKASGATTTTSPITTTRNDHGNDHDHDHDNDHEHGSNAESCETLQSACRRDHVGLRTVTATAATPTSIVQPASGRPPVARGRPEAGLELEVIMPVPTTTVADVAVLATDRLDAYRLAVEFCALASRVRVTSASLRDQLDRASASIVLNLAEGVGRTSRPDQAHFFAIARGRALESAAAFDLLRARGTLSAEVHLEGRRLPPLTSKGRRPCWGGSCRTPSTPAHRRASARPARCRSRDP